MTAAGQYWADTTEGGVPVNEDQVPRLKAWQAAHPDWTIKPPLDPLRVSVIPMWRATSPSGDVDVFEYSLETLMDRLEGLT